MWPRPESSREAGRRPRRLTRAAALAGAAVCAAALPEARQDPQRPPVFRTGVETVAIYATVMNGRGDLVPHLTADDFVVLDEGRRQTLTVFSSDFQPITALLLVDTSASMTPSLDLARAAAEQFVIRLMPGDRARVGSFSDRIDINEDFLGDRDELLRVLREETDIGNPTRLWDAVDQSMTALAGVGGRRVIMLLTDGVDTLSRMTLRALLERARGDDPMVYVFQFATTARARQFEILPAGPGPARSSDTLRQPPADGLRQLARATGGGYFFIREHDNVSAICTRVAMELHQQYVLGFTPAVLDGRTHELQVRVRRSGLTVRAREHYVAARRTPGGGSP